MRTIRSLTPRAALTALAVLLAVVALSAVAVAANGGSTVTKARLERSLPVVFADLYSQQAEILGRTGVTPASLDAHAVCDKGGSTIADVGPGATWVCLMSWQDPAVPMPSEGYGKFELNVHSNDCYSAAGQTKLTGFFTITDTHGREVSNPVFEFDGCFDPHGDDAPTGISFPSLTSVVSTAVTRDAEGLVGAQLSCGTGAVGCSGTATLSIGDRRVASLPYDMIEETTTTLHFAAPVPDKATEVVVTLAPATGYGSTSGSTLPVQ